MPTVLSRHSALACVCLVLSQTSVASVRAQATHYLPSDSIFVGAAAGDFYALDALHRRLYGAGRKVVDIDAKRVSGMVADTTAENLFFGSFALAPELNRGVIRNGMVFSLSTGQVIDTIPVLGDAMLYDPPTQRAFILSDTVFVIDVKHAKLVSKILVKGAGESVVTDGRGRLYLNLRLQNAIAVVDAKKMTVVAQYSLAPGRSPMGLAIDADHNRLFASCDSEVVVLNATNGKVVAVLPTPGQADQSAFDAKTRLLFAPGGRGFGVTIIHEDSPDKFSIVETLTAPQAAATKAVVDPTTHLVYMPHRLADKSFSYLVLAPTAN
jgi:DNA-binding beta-propeller fold protein YncE